MAVSKRLRYEILRRDNHTCRYCGSAAPDVPLTVDHVLPVALGGTDDPTNLVAACTSCNSGKSATPPGAPLVADVAADALRWSLAMRAVADKRARDRELLEQDRRLVTYEWDRWTSTHNDQPFERPTDWPLSVDLLTAAGIDVLDIINAIGDTMLRSNIRDRWAYTFGSLWRELDRRQQTARQLLTLDQTEPT